VITAWRTLKLIALVVARNLFRTATDTANAIRPAKLLKSYAALLIRVKLSDEFHQVYV